jgi:hypothetical protein
VMNGRSEQVPSANLRPLADNSGEKQVKTDHARRSIPKESAAYLRQVPCSCHAIDSPDDKYGPVTDVSHLEQSNRASESCERRLDRKRTRQEPRERHSDKMARAC